jgi:hypothetical protein
VPLLELFTTMPKYILNVVENWNRTYIVTAETEDEVIEEYLMWLSRGGSPKTVEQFGEPEYIDDGPTDAFIVAGEYPDDDSDPS